MMRSAILLCLLALAGCAAAGGSPAGQAPGDSPILQEIRGYAMASCLAYQPGPALRQQGYGWASAVVQGMDGGIDGLSSVAETVRRASADAPPPTIRDETAPGQEMQLTILHCYQVAHSPAVEAAVRDAARAYGLRLRK